MDKKLLIAIALLLFSAVSDALELHWSSGSTSIAFSEAMRCTLFVEAGPTGALPGEWQLLWDASSGSVRPLRAPQAGCADGITNVSDILDPLSAIDSSAHVTTAHFCSEGRPPAIARYVFDLPAGCVGKLKAVALDPADPDSGTVMASNVVTFNGGLSAPFAPVILHATHLHGSSLISVRGIGAGLMSVRNPSLAASDGNRIELSMTGLSDTAIDAQGILSDALPVAALQVQSGGGEIIAAPLRPDIVLGQSPASVTSVLFKDGDLNVQPRDFAFVFNRVPTGTPNVWRALYHLVYTTLFRNQGGSSQRTLRHTWTSTPDNPFSWHQPPAVTWAAGTNGPAAWDGQQLYAPSIVYANGRFVMFYAGVNNLGAESIGYTVTSATSTLDTTNTVWMPSVQVMSPVFPPPAGVLRPGWVALPSAQFPGAMRDPYVMLDPEHPGKLLMYFVAGDLRFQNTDGTYKNVVGVVRGDAINPSSLWQDLGYFRSTDKLHGGLVLDESPHVFPDGAHGGPTQSGAALWRLMMTDAGSNGFNDIRFQQKVIGASIADTSLDNWQPHLPAQPPINLYDYLHQDQTVFGWVATEYLHIEPGVDFLAAYDGEGIAITRMYWGGPDFVLGFPTVTGVQPRPKPVDVRLAISELALGTGRVGFRLDLPAPMRVIVTAYDVAGRRTCKLLERQLPAGKTQFAWDGRDDRGVRLTSGMYFARLSCEGGTRVVRVPFVR